MSKARKVECALLLLWTALAFIPVFSLFAESADQAFDAANKLYEQGKFSEASAAYEKLISGGQYSAAVFFNAGNAHFKQGQLGKAVADYRKAQMLDAHDADVRKNLQLARTKARGGNAFQAPLWQRISSLVSLNVATVLFLVFVWAFFILVALRFLNPILIIRLRAYLYLSLLMSVVLGLGFLVKYSEETTSTAIVITGETDVRNGPLEEAPSVFKVRDGIEMEILDRKDDWLQVTDASDRIGWIRKDQVSVFRAADGLFSR